MPVCNPHRISPSISRTKSPPLRRHSQKDRSAAHLSPLWTNHWPAPRRRWQWVAVALPPVTPEESQAAPVPSSSVSSRKKKNRRLKVSATENEEASYSGSEKSPTDSSVAPIRKDTD